MDPTTSQTRGKIFQLGQLDLKFAFIASSPLGKDIEDQLTPINDPDLKGRFQIALLGGVEIPIKNNQVRFHLPKDSLDFLYLSLADQSSRGHPLEALCKPPYHLCPGSPGQPLKLIQAVLQGGLLGRGGKLHTYQECLFLKSVRMGGNSLQDSNE
jgi:hypothetical protein